MQRRAESESDHSPATRVEVWFCEHGDTNRWQDNRAVFQM